MLDMHKLKQQYKELSSNYIDELSQPLFNTQKRSFPTPAVGPIVAKQGKRSPSLIKSNLQSKSQMSHAMRVSHQMEASKNSGFGDKSEFHDTSHQLSPVGVLAIANIQARDPTFTAEIGADATPRTNNLQFEQPLSASAFNSINNQSVTFE